VGVAEIACPLLARPILLPSRAASELQQQLSEARAANEALGRELREAEERAAAQRDLLRRQGVDLDELRAVHERVKVSTLFVLFPPFND